jgi:hypothetical protein
MEIYGELDSRVKPLCRCFRLWAKVRRLLKLFFWGGGVGAGIPARCVHKGYIHIDSLEMGNFGDDSQARVYQQQRRYYTFFDSLKNEQKKHRQHFKVYTGCIAEMSYV